MQGLYTVPLTKVNIISSPVDDDGYSTDTEPIHNDGLLEEALVIDLNRPIRLKRSKFYHDLSLSPEFKCYNDYHAALQANENGLIVFGLVHRFVSDKLHEFNDVDLRVLDYVDLMEQSEAVKLKKRVKVSRTRLRKLNLRLTNQVVKRRPIRPLKTRQWKREEIEKLKRKSAQELDGQ